MREKTGQNSWVSGNSARKVGCLEITSGNYTKAYFLNIATHRQADFLANEFLELHFQPYRPVREQLLAFLRAVNRQRQLAGFQRIPYSVIRFKRRIVRAFQPAPVDDGPGDQTMDQSQCAV
jgi:hypothetical protein